MQRQLATGSFTLQAKYAVDQLDLFNQNNPTYKDQFTAGLWQRGIKSIGMGAAAGAVHGGPHGAAAGAVLGTATTAIDTAFAIHGEQLRQKGLEMMPDQLFGDAASATFLSNTRFGIYWVVKTNLAYTHMLNEYYTRGFPTNIITNIDNLSAAANSIYGTCKLLQGRMLSTLNNTYITNAVDKKLQEGVVII
jgi:hypothetical protein